MNQSEQSKLAQTPHDDDMALVERWLSALNTALASAAQERLQELFASDSHWRDLLAFTWSLTPFRGAKTIAEAMSRLQPEVQARGFAVAANRTQPRRVTRLGIRVIEAILEFETRLGRGSGVVRLLEDDPSRAWVFLTALDELAGCEEKIGPRRPTGEAYSRNFGGDNWLDQRTKSQLYADRDPTVLVVGAGQAGLTLAARLVHLEVDVLVVDKHRRVGDNWRERYHSLALHNQIIVNHLPYMPFPPGWPKYLPKDMLANWLEAYAWAMQINAWTGTEFLGGTYDEAAGCWSVEVRREDGSVRTLRPRHLVLANGVSGIPRIPELPGIADFRGEVSHSNGFKDASRWRGKKVLVLGTGTSAHDVTQELHSHGAQTTLIQRGSTTVVSIDPSAKLNYALYEEGPPLEDCDLVATSATYPLRVLGYQMAVKKMVEFDKKLIDALIAKGFKYDLGEDSTGHQMKYFRRGGGYYLNAGCSDLIISGEVGLLQYDRVDRFVAEGARLKDGSVKEADLIVLATGYISQEQLVRRLLGEVVSERVGQIWGFAPDGEFSNMWKRTPQRGLWFMAGSIIQCRIYSKYLALQIKAMEEGLLPLQAA